MQNVAAKILVKALFLLQLFLCSNLPRREICNLICVSNTTIYLIVLFIYFCLKSLTVFSLFILDTMSVWQEARYKKSLPINTRECNICCDLRFCCHFWAKKGVTKVLHQLCLPWSNQAGAQVHVLHQEFSCN